MGMNELIIEKPTGQLYLLKYPSEFAEMTRRHLAAVSRWMHRAGKDENWWFKLIRDFTGMKRRHVRMLEGEQAVHIGPTLDFLQEPYTNERSLVDRICFLIGPQDHLKNYTIEQLSYADSYAMAYHAEKSAKYLDHFFASAYRPFFLQWHKRQLNFVWLCRLAPGDIKRLALMNYTGLRSNLVLKHPVTFEGGDENTGMEDFGWTGTILALAGEKFGPYRQAKQVRVPDAFTLFEMNGLQIKRANEKTTQQ